MRTLDRYVLKSFIYSAVLWFVVLMSLRVVADLFVNMDEFTEGNQPLAQVLSNICSFYGYQIFLFITEMGGLSIVAAAAFTLARMNHTNELTAMLASGVSLRRVIWPVVLAAFALGATIVIDQEYVIPRVAPKLVRDRDDVAGANAFVLPLVTDERNSAWHAGAYNPSEKSPDMAKPIILMRDQNATLTAVIVGQTAQPGKLDGQHGWFLANAELDRVAPTPGPWRSRPNTQRIATSVGPPELLKAAGAAGQDVVGVELPRVPDHQLEMDLSARRFELGATGEAPKLTGPRFAFKGPDGSVMATFCAREADWIAADVGIGGQWQLVDGRLFYPTSLTSQQIVLRRSKRWLQYLSTPQVKQLLASGRLADPAPAELVRHARVTDPLNGLVMLLLGLPFIVSRERNLKTSAGLCLLVVGAFYVFIYLSRFYVHPPVLAVWLPILLFGPVAAWLVGSIKT